MRKLVLSVFVSLDGYINGPGGEFIGPDWSADLDRWVTEVNMRYDTLLFGRSTWQMMTAHWPGAETAPDTPAPQRDVARFMNAARKIVFSRTAPDLSAWSNSELADEPLADFVAREKRGDGRDMVIFGSARLAQMAMQADLIDEYALLTLPMLFGGGTRLFEGHGLRRKLRLTETRAMDTGAVLSRYATV